MPQAAMDESPILAIEFNRVGGGLIPRTASKLISRTERTVAQEVGPRSTQSLQSSEFNTQCLVLAVMPSTC